jgi:hypothetical protein
MPVVSTKKFVKEYTPLEVYVDPRFQRREVWPNTTGSAWLASLTHDIEFSSPFCLVNIRKSLKKARANCINALTSNDLDHDLVIKNDGNVIYFQNLLDRGYEWISIDGQNRTKFLLDFIDNKVSITCSGDHACIDMDGLTHEFNGVFYKDLPVRLQDKFQAAQHTIQEASCASVSLMAHYFRSINDGHALNDQEKRQSNLTEIADKVREYSKAYNSSLIRVVPKDRICRMDDDELVAKMLIVLMHPREGLSKHDLNNFYKMGLSQPNSSYSAADFKRCEKILAFWGKTIDQQQTFKPSKMIPNKTSWAVLYACTWAYDNDYTTTDHAEFFTKLVELDKKLCEDSISSYHFERSKCLKAGNDPAKATMLSKSKYYHNLTGLPQKPFERSNRIQDLTAAIMIRPAKFRLCLV